MNYGAVQLKYILDWCNSMDENDHRKHLYQFRSHQNQLCSLNDGKRVVV